MYIYSYSIHQRHISSLLSSQFDDICLQKRNILPNSTWQCHHNFFTSPFKRGTFCFSNAISSQSFITIRTWTKNHAFPNWEIPKISISFFWAPKKNQRPKTQPGTANLRSAELWRDWNSAGWGWEPRWPRLDSPQPMPRGLFTGSPGGQTSFLD